MLVGFMLLAAYSGRALAIDMAGNAPIDPFDYSYCGGKPVYPVIGFNFATWCGPRNQIGLGRRGRLPAFQLAAGQRLATGLAHDQAAHPPGADGEYYRGGPGERHPRALLWQGGGARVHLHGLERQHVDGGRRGHEDVRRALAIATSGREPAVADVALLEVGSDQRSLLGIQGTGSLAALAVIEPGVQGAIINVPHA